MTSTTPDLLPEGTRVRVTAFRTESEMRNYGEDAPKIHGRTGEIVDRDLDDTRLPYKVQLDDRSGLEVYTSTTGVLWVHAVEPEPTPIKDPDTLVKGDQYTSPVRQEHRCLAKDLEGPRASGLFCSRPKDHDGRQHVAAASHAGEVLAVWPVVFAVGDRVKITAMMEPAGTVYGDCVGRVGVIDKIDLTGHMTGQDIHVEFETPDPSLPSAAWVQAVERVKDQSKATEDEMIAVGDRVRIIRLSDIPGNRSSEDGKSGAVTEIDHGTSLPVRVLVDGNDVPLWCYQVERLGVATPTEPAPLTVGDRVWIEHYRTDSVPDADYDGLTGTLDALDTAEGTTLPYYVAIDAASASRLGDPWVEGSKLWAHVVKRVAAAPDVPADLDPAGVQAAADGLAAIAERDRLRERVRILEAQAREHAEWKETLTAEAHRLADREGYCSDFDEFMEEHGLERRKRQHRVRTRVTIELDVTVEASDDDHAIEQVDGMDHSTIRDFIYGLNRHEIEVYEVDARDAEII